MALNRNQKPHSLLEIYILYALLNIIISRLQDNVVCNILLPSWLAPSMFLPIKFVPTDVSFFPILTCNFGVENVSSFCIFAHMSSNPMLKWLFCLALWKESPFHNIEKIVKSFIAPIASLRVCLMSIIHTSRNSYIPSSTSKYIYTSSLFKRIYIKNIVFCDHSMKSIWWA